MKSLGKNGQHRFLNGGNAWQIEIQPATAALKKIERLQRHFLMDGKPGFRTSQRCFRRIWIGRHLFQNGI